MYCERCRAEIRDFDDYKARSEPGGFANLELSVRAYNCLANHGVVKIDEIRLMTDREFLFIKNIGPKTRDEIRKAVAEYDKKQIQPESAEGA